MKPLRAIGDAVRPICDRFWLFTIAGLGLGILGSIVFVVGYSQAQLTPERIALLGSMSTGLLMLIQKVIEAQGTRRAMDQLHNSAPASTEQMTVAAEQVDVKEATK